MLIACAFDALYFRLVHCFGLFATLMAAFRHAAAIDCRFCRYAAAFSMFAVTFIPAAGGCHVASLATFHAALISRRDTPFRHASHALMLILLCLFAAGRFHA